MTSIEDRIGSILGEDEEFKEPAPDEEEPNEPETEDAEEEADDEEQGEVEESEAEDDAEEVSISTISELAEHIGTDVADLYNLKIPVTKADGSKAEVSLGEWKDSYRESDLVKAERQKFEQEVSHHQEAIAQKAQAVDTAYVHADAVLKAAEKQLMGDISAIEQLKNTDPTKFVTESYELQKRKDGLKELREKAVQDYQANQQQLMQEQEQQRQQYLSKQGQLLTEYIPEWRDSDRMQQERSELADYLTSSGVPEAEVNAISSAKVVELARKAMLWDKQNKAKPEAKKKVVSIGKKVLKSAKAQTKQTRKTRQYSDDMAKARKALQGRDGDKAGAALIEKYFLNDLE